MKNAMRLLSLIGIMLIAFAVVSAEQEQAAPPASEPVPAAVRAEVADVAKATAEMRGVVVGNDFLSNALRSAAADSLVETGAAGASCQVTCSGGKVGGIVCGVGEMCTCSCMGGGPDCSCNSH